MVEMRVESGDLPATLLLSHEFIDDPYSAYDRLRTEAPVWCVPGTSIVVVSSFAAISEAVGRPQDFSSNLGALLCRADDGTPGLVPYGDGTVNVLATADPPTHGIHRSAVFPELVNRRMTELEPEIDSLALQFLGPAVASSNVDFMASVANAIPIRVVSRLIGWEGEEAEVLFQAAVDSSSILAATRSAEEITATTERTAEVGMWIAQQLQAALDVGATGLLGVIAQAVQAGDIDFVAGVIIMHTLLSAGGESTTSLLGNAVHQLATDHALQSRVREDRSLIVPLIEEVLRVESPFRYHLRQVRHATELQGVPIAAGSTVLLMWGAANRDPAEYERPNEIVLDRPTPKHHMGFGRGIHHCVGAPLARLEAKVVLSRLLDLTERFSLDPDQPPVRDHSLMVRRFISLPLLIEPSTTL